MIVFLFVDGLVSLCSLCGGQVACTWDDVKSLRQDMERSLSSSAVHFRIKLLQAAAQMQVITMNLDLNSFIVIVWHSTF
jgi:hypothetical protein